MTVGIIQEIQASKNRARHIIFNMMIRFWCSHLKNLYIVEQFLNYYWMTKSKLYNKPPFGSPRLPFSCLESLEKEEGLECCSPHWTILETCCVFHSSVCLSVSSSIPSPCWQTPAPLPWPEQTWHIHFHGFGWPAASPLYYLFLGVCSTFVPETLPGYSVLWGVERHIIWAKTAGKLHMKCLFFFLPEVLYHVLPFPIPLLHIVKNVLHQVISFFKRENIVYCKLNTD